MNLAKKTFHFLFEKGTCPHENFVKISEGLYAGRIVGGDRHYRHFDSAAAARNSSGA
jgi:hypothetical protein